MKLNKISIKIENYKNILKLPYYVGTSYNKDHVETINFYSNKINLIVGDNNIGKTNLLKAISKLNLVQGDNAKIYDFINDKPIGYEPDKNKENKWRFQLDFDLPDKWVEDEVRNSNILTQDEFSNCNHELENAKNYYIAFTGKIINETSSVEHFPPILRKQETIFSNHKDYFTGKLHDKIKATFYPLFENLIEENDIKLTKINFKKGNLDAKDSTYSRLCSLIKAFAKCDDYEKIIEYLNKLKSPRVDKSDEDAIATREENKRMVDFINNSFKDKIDKIFESFKSLHAKLEIVLDDEYDIWPKISNNVKIEAKTLENQGKGIQKLIKLIYLLNICRADEDKNHIILVDEIENYLSINTQECLLKYLKDILKKCSNLFIIGTTHSPIFFIKQEKEEKWDSYLNIICCCLNQENGLLCTNIGNLDETIKAGMVISDSHSQDDKHLPDAISVLSYLLNSSEYIIKKLFDENN